MARFILAFSALLLAGFSALATNATSIVLAWDPPAGTNVIDHYCLYAGPASRTYTNRVLAGPGRSSSLPVARYGRTYIAATAVDTAGLESDFSNEVIWTNLYPWKSNILITVTSTGQTILRAASLAGPWTNLNRSTWIATNPPAPLYFRGRGTTNRIAITGLRYWTSPTNDVPP